MTPGHRAPVVALRFAYQGEPGAYSETAARKHFDESAHWHDRLGGAPPVGVPCTSFKDVVDAVVDGHAECGFLPVENSLEGNIDEATDQLVDCDLHVVGETELRIRHMLMATPGTTLSALSHVHSHPQGLRQCRDYLEAHPAWKRVPEYDTAGSARIVAGLDEDGHAAIAGPLAAEHHGLEILAEGIESSADNYTRFLCVAPDDLHPEPDASVLPPNGPGYKTSLVFAVRHRPGALYETLGVFAAHDVNLSKLESRPRRKSGRRWDYLFFVDFEGHAAEPGPADALAKLARSLSFLKVLGSYPKAVEKVMG